MELNIVGDIARLRLTPGDIIVIRCPGRLSMDMREAIKATVEREFPGHKMHGAGVGHGTGGAGAGVLNPFQIAPANSAV